MQPQYARVRIQPLSSVYEFVNGVSHSFQLIVGEGVRGGGVAKAGEDRKRGEDCRTSEVRGLGVRARRFCCF
jgi:hypothetical protein